MGSTGRSGSVHHSPQGEHNPINVAAQYEEIAQEVQDTIQSVLLKAREATFTHSGTMRDTFVDYDLDDKESRDSVLDKTKICRSIGFHVKVLWVCLSIMVTVGCSFSLLQSHWFTHRSDQKSLGLYSFCITDRSTKALPIDMSFEKAMPAPQTCDFYGESFKLEHLPSNTWQVACLLYGGGCLLMTLTSLSSLLTLIVADRWADRLAIYTGYLQTLAVVLLIVALVVFPVGLDCSFVRAHCGLEARMYSAGQCQVGWAYMLAIMSTALAMFCPVLSQYTDFREGYDSSGEYL